MTLRARLTLGFLAIAVLLLIPLGISLKALRSVEQTTENLQEREFSASQALGQALRTSANLRATETLFPLFPDDYAASLEAGVDSLAAYADSLRVSGGVEGTAAAALLRSLDSLRVALPAYRAAATNDTAAADDISRLQVRPAIDSVDATLEVIGRQIERRSVLAAQQAGNTAATANSATVSAVALVILLAALVAVLITRSVSRPVRNLDRGMRAVADGDFNHPLGFSARRGDEFGRLAASYQEMARRLAELDKLKAEFVSVASHELKTPINVILGYLQLFDEGLYGPLTTRQREVVSTLMSQGQSLARLVQQLLDVSRFEAGGGRLELREVPLEQFVSELETAFHVLAHQREIRFHLLTGEGLPEFVHWDADRMNEVLGNLLSNAFKFTDRGGTVELEVTSTAEIVQLLVRDTGAGIPPSQLPHIFRKFYQADNQGAASLKGTGLGLAIAKEIVEAHGGEISVDSTPGVGTTFCIRLPMRPRPRRRGGPVTPVHAEAVT